jgi:hypothetical protein
LIVTIPRLSDIAIQGLSGNSNSHAGKENNYKKSEECRKQVSALQSGREQIMIHATIHVRFCFILLQFIFDILESKKTETKDHNQ